MNRSQISTTCSKYHLDDEGDVTDKPVEMHDVYLEIQAMLLKHKVEAFGCKVCFCTVL